MGDDLPMNAEGRIDRAVSVKPRQKKAGAVIDGIPCHEDPAVGLERGRHEKSTHLRRADHLSTGAEGGVEATIGVIPGQNRDKERSDLRVAGDEDLAVCLNQKSMGGAV